MLKIIALFIHIEHPLDITFSIEKLILKNKDQKHLCNDPFVNFITPDEDGNY